MKVIQDFLTVLCGIFFFKDSFISLMGVNSSFLINNMLKQSSRVALQAYLFGRTPLVVASEHESQAPTLTAGREQEEEFNGCPDNENTNEEEQNSAKQTNSKSPEDELYKLYIELFIDLVPQLPVI